VEDASHLEEEPEAVREVTNASISDGIGRNSAPIFFSSAGIGCEAARR